MEQRGWLVLRRNENEKVVFDLGGGERIEVAWVKQGGKMRLLCKAPQAVKILREELLARAEERGAGKDAA